MAKLTINSLVSGFPSVTTLNDNFQAIEAALENTLSRDGSTPNHMNADLDMNGNRILNALAQSGDGFIYKGDWITAISYDINNLVYVPVGTGSSYDGAALICKAAHTSGTLNTDYTAGNWGILATRGASGGGSGDLVSTNNLSDVANAVTARSNLGAAISGANDDITSLSALASVPTVVQEAIPFTGVLSKAADYTVTTSDRAKLIDCTASLALTLPAASSAKNGFVIAVRNSASATNTTIYPDGAETINGESSLDLGPFASALVFCTGSAWLVVRGTDIPSQLGNTGKVLGTTGSTLDWVGGDWVRIQDNVAISAVASIDLTLDTSTYSDFILVITDARPSSNGVALLGKPLYGTAQLTTLNGGVNDLTTGLETNRWPYLIGSPTSYQVGSSYYGSCVARISGASGTKGGGVSVFSSSTGREYLLGYPFACECSSHYQWDNTARVMTGIRMVWTGGNFTANGTYSLFGLKR